MKTSVEKAATANISDMPHTLLNTSHDTPGLAFRRLIRRPVSSFVQSGTMESSASGALLDTGGVLRDISVRWVVLCGEMGYWGIKYVGCRRMDTRQE